MPGSSFRAWLMIAALLAAAATAGYDVYLHGAAPVSPPTVVHDPPTAADLAKALTPWLSFGPRFLELPGANGRTLPGASAASTSRTGRSAGRSMPEAARVRIGNSARGDRSRSTLQACLPERRPSIERDSLYVAETGTNVK